MRARLNMLEGGSEALKTRGKHLITRCFFWEDGEDEEAINDFVERFISDVEFRRQSIEGNADWCHINRIYEAAEEVVWRFYSNLPHFLGYTLGDRKTEKEHREAYAKFEMYCKSVYKYIKQNINALMGNPDYQEALLCGRNGLERFVKEHILPKVERM